MGALVVQFLSTPLRGLIAPFAQAGRTT